jgi:hypothetical protein
MNENKFFIWVGQVVTVGALMVCVLLIAMSLGRLIEADKAATNNPTFVIHPDSSSLKVKGVK